MRRVISILFICSIILFSGCLDGKPKPKMFKGIDDAQLLPECEEFAEDVCSLYACMVDQCWCFPESSDTPSAILAEGKTTVKTKEEAIAVVEEYVQSINSGYTNIDNATQVNNIFWHVFAYNSENDEKVFTVAADGTIISTVCGV